MSLDDLISSTHKEIVGSRTKNRLTVQISYAIQLIMDFYSTDFLVMMDYIEDISIIIDPENPASIHLYQVKTKSADKQYRMTTVINEKWFQKLYLATKSLKPRAVASMGKDKKDEIKNAILEIYYHNNKCLVGYTNETVANYKAMTK